jgi:O-antigen/teichoic acid export membrane protein
VDEKVSLKNKAISALFFSFGGFIANSGIQFIITIVMARLLTPKDYGIIGMVAVFIAISQIFIDSGMTQALVREKEVSQADYSTVFYYNLLVAIAMYVLLFISANTISLYFREPLLIKIIRFVGLGVIINSFGLIQRTMLIRKLDFKTQTKIDVISSVASGSMGIVLAYLGYGVWSLVVLSLANQLTSASLLCLWNRWLPSATVNVNSFKRLFGFGWKMLCTGLLATLYGNIFNVIIGRVYTATQLGYYAKSQQLRDVAANSITNSVTKVSYPVLSSVQDERDRLKSGFEKIIKNSSFLTFPLMIGLAAIANPLVHLLFGDHWMPMVPYFQILCLSGMTFPHRSLNLTVLLVKGRSDIFLRLDILKIVIGMVMITTVIVLDYGIYGLLWTSFLSCKVAFVVNSYFSEKYISYSTTEQIKDMLPTLLISAVMGMIVYFCGDMLPQSNGFRLAGQISIGVITYIALSKLFRIEELDTMVRLAGSFYKKIRTKSAVTMEKGSE